MWPIATECINKQTKYLIFFYESKTKFMCELPLAIGFEKNKL